MAVRDAFPDLGPAVCIVALEVCAPFYQGPIKALEVWAVNDYQGDEPC